MTTKSIFSTVFLFCAAVMALGAFSPAMAEGDEGLYDAVPPEGSVFIRFINDKPGSSELVPSVNGRERDGAKFGLIKPYSVAGNGNVDVGFGDAKTSFDAAPGGHYTVILQKDDTLRIEKDPEAADPLKSQIIFYNLTGRDDITVRTADGKITVIGPVKAGELQERAVNPIKVSFAVFSGDEKFADLEDWPLERGQSYTISIVEGDDGKGVGSYVRARLSEE
ncbi:MAG: alginate O-acetyltransferase AlgF [Alphaproteobacteria bacterium]|nr:alginate O-acetyltransferase AlgF [Alphaproteobacteria bacterium]